jgi:hypothetical protein
MDTPPAPPSALSRLTGLGPPALDRVPVRTRGSGITLSSWRLSVACDQGAGTVTRIEPAAGDALYRGDGIFLGWSQDDLKSVYGMPRGPVEEPNFEIPQLG